MFQEKYNEQQLQVLVLADQFTPELDYLKLDEASWVGYNFLIKLLMKFAFRPLNDSIFSNSLTFAWNGSLGSSHPGLL